ncbi:MAG: 30S ribosomal protein S13 [Candidatus Vogelbacteria bacterium]|nr:30S ribosomal protein S13 [Candidatus Vogelbacteria bacterium]
MMRIAGITIPDNKRLEVALTTIYGIGRSRARNILDQAKISYDERPKKLSAASENAVRQLVENYKTEGALKREVGGNIKRLIDIKSYRGSRHGKRLPTRGQRTKTNSRTRRGNVRKTMSSGRKKVEKK